MARAALLPAHAGKTDGADGANDEAMEVGREVRRVRIREAELDDAQGLASLYQQARPGEGETVATVRAYLGSGYSLLVEGGAGEVLAAVRWQPEGDGWAVDRVATLPTERGNSFGRWLMTRLEALAIRGNVKSLTLQLDDETLLPYYRRMGYQQAGDDQMGLSKRVGGTWQRQAQRGV